LYVISCEKVEHGTCHGAKTPKYKGNEILRNSNQAILAYRSFANGNIFPLLSTLLRQKPFVLWLFSRWHIGC